MTSINITMNIEDALQENDSVIWKCKGRSMLPYIDEKRDLVELKSLRRAPKRHEVVLYAVDQTGQTENEDARQYVLHRVIGKEENTYVLLGDNCVTPEHAPADRIIAVMTGLVRDGKKVNTESIKYKLYRQLWIRPWRLRVFAIKVRNRLRRMTEKEQ